MKRIAIFGSGKGTNAENIIRHFADSDVARVNLVLCNRKDAGILKRAKENSIPGVYFSMAELQDGTVLAKLKASGIDLIVLAGFLKKIPLEILDAFEGRVINIHPALLPDYGGEGMYGMNVHRAVVDNEESETGITIHYVNGEYDEGEIVFQDSIEIDPGDSPEEVAYKVQELEHRHYPSVIEWVVSELEAED